MRFVRFDERAVTLARGSVADGLHDRSDGDLLRRRRLRHAFQVEREQPRVEAELRRPVEELGVLAVAVDGESPCDGPRDELIFRGPVVVLKRSLEIAHERPLFGTSAKVGFVETANST